MDFKIMDVDYAQKQFSYNPGLFRSDVDLAAVLREQEIDPARVYTLSVNASALELPRETRLNEFSSLRTLRLTGSRSIRIYCECFAQCPVETVWLNAPSIALDNGVFADAAQLQELNLTGALQAGQDGAFPDFLFSGCVSLRAVYGSFRGASLSGRAFFGCESLEKAIDFTVASVGSEAFAHCYHLRNIHLPDGLKSLGAGAFNDCVNLEGIYLPDSLETLGEGAFSCCNSMRTAHLSAAMTEVPDAAFSGCTVLGDVFLPGGITRVGAHAFENCMQLSSPRLPAGLTSIGACAFYGCSALGEVILPDSLAEIGDDAFAACPNLTLRARAGSLAEHYANGARLRFEPLD